MSSPAREYRMRNGRSFSVKPCIEAGTAHTREHLKAQIAEALHSLSCRSRWHRFASPVARLTDDQLEHLVDLDGKDRVAWCALTGSGQDERGIGLARYIRFAERPAAAEFAVTVIDEFQRQGVGRALLEHLLRSAAENGLDTLEGFVMPSNRAMLALAARFDGRVEQADDYLLKVVLPVRQAPSDA
jgi:GNAT superfamily N-acetyltransferase